jgi:hypothetical protein
MSHVFSIIAHPGAVLQEDYANMDALSSKPPVFREEDGNLCIMHNALFRGFPVDKISFL